MLALDYNLFIFVQGSVGNDFRLSHLLLATGSLNVSYFQILPSFFFRFYWSIFIKMKEAYESCVPFGPYVDMGF